MDGIFVSLTAFGSFFIHFFLCYFSSHHFVFKQFFFASSLSHFEFVIFSIFMVQHIAVKYVHFRLYIETILFYILGACLHKCTYKSQKSLCISITLLHKYSFCRFILVIRHQFMRYSLWLLAFVLFSSIFH